jgi:aminopeptidase N
MISLGYNEIMIPGLAILFLCLFPSGGQASPPSEETLPSYHLRVSFDIQASRVIGEASIQVSQVRELSIDKGDLQILELSVKGVPVDISSDRASHTMKLNPGETVKIRYSGTFRALQGSGSLGPADRPDILSRVIGEKGIFLAGTWYPQVAGLCHYRLTASLPEGYEAVSEAEKIEIERKDGSQEFSFSFPHPLENLTLIATDRFRVSQDQQDGIAIYAYFFPEDERLAQTYVEATKKYLKLYEGLLGKYPYKRFSVVENFLPTGYSMPTYTLLGQGVVRLPFILETSLGHEILHQWFGNLVYVDYGKGNWAEGLTSYLADHYYEEQKGKGFEYRKGSLIDYRSYVNPKNEIPLKDFRGRNSRPSQAIGYGKALMVFHLLKNLVGETAFFDSLKAFLDEKRFQSATWQDLRSAFEKNSKRELGWFFQQWVDERGMAEFDLGEMKVRPRDGKFEVSFEVRQRGRANRFDLPISFYSNGGRVKHIISVEKEKGSFQVLLDQYPHGFIVDENYDVARTLSDEEFPPVIARLLGGENFLLVPPPERKEIYQRAMDYFKRMGARVEREGQLKDEDIKKSSLVILDKRNPLAERLYGRVEAEGGFSVAVRENPWNPKMVIAILHAESKEEMAAAFPKLVHYGKYSFVSFNQGENGNKRTEDSRRGMVKELTRETTAVEASAVKTLPEVIPLLADKIIVYVGESHDRFSHHLVQLEIIQTLHRMGKKVAIGMEMFQRPFQGTLDDYLSGRTGEKEFLKKSEYFKRWQFDYNLYRPILQFARAEKIPVVALNIQREITEKVGKNGLDSLSEEEKRSIPSRMDFSDRAYREKLEKVFREHPSFEAKNFDFFLQAQILWDETMAESVDRFLKENPGYQMVVLAGSGHLAYGSGIPQRAARRNGFDYSILLNEGGLEKDIAHFIVNPAPVPLEGTPRLMITLAESNGPPVIQGFSHGSVSEKAGLQKGDRILSLDQVPVQGADDVRIELLFKKKGDRAKVKILREDPPGGEREMELEVVLQ